MTTAGTNRVCSRCLELKDTVVGRTDESGVTLPPLHPRCRCAIVYREVRDAKPKQMPRMSADATPKWPPRDKSKVISKEEYLALRSLAETNGIALSGVKKFDGSAVVMHEIIETLAVWQEKFPATRNERYKLTLKIDELMSAEDFAITCGKVISLNANAYRDINLLAAEYRKAMESGWFVKGTKWRAIIHHEFGHVVAETYNLNGLKIACEITGLSKTKVIEFLKNNLSEYAGSFVDGGEIISEVFADISAGKACDFSRKFYNRVLEMTR